MKFIKFVDEEAAGNMVKLKNDQVQMYRYNVKFGGQKYQDESMYLRT